MNLPPGGGQEPSSSPLPEPFPNIYATRMRRDARTAERLQTLRTRVRAEAENRPGIYRMFGPGGELLYVGKSIKVRSRLLSYFTADRREKAAEIVGHAHAIEWEYTPSEFAALLAELQTIKRMRPVYNVEHKRDRAFCFVKITREPAPRVLVVGNVVPDGSAYFGPYRGRASIRDAVRQISDLLELRDCPTVPRRIRMEFADQFELFRSEKTPQCIRGELGRCIAPCAGRCTEREYNDRVDLARRFLEGDAERPLEILRARMQDAADRMQFEYAAQLRDRAVRLQTIKDEMVALRGAIEGLTFLYAVPGHQGDDRLYLLKRGTVRAELPMPYSESERSAAAARAKAIYESLEPENGEVQPSQVAEVLLIARWFRLHPEQRELALPIDRRAFLRSA